MALACHCLRDSSFLRPRWQRHTHSFIHSLVHSLAHSLTRLLPTHGALMGPTAGPHQAARPSPASWGLDPARGPSGRARAGWDSEGRGCRRQHFRWAARTAWEGRPLSMGRVGMVLGCEGRVVGWGQTPCGLGGARRTWPPGQEGAQLRWVDKTPISMRWGVVLARGSSPPRRPACPSLPPHRRPVGAWRGRGRCFSPRRRQQAPSSGLPSRRSPERLYSLPPFTRLL